MRFSIFLERQNATCDFVRFSKIGDFNIDLGKFSQFLHFFSLIISFEWPIMVQIFCIYLSKQQLAFSFFNSRQLKRSNFWATGVAFPPSPLFTLAPSPFYPCRIFVAFSMLQTPSDGFQPWRKLSDYWIGTFFV